MVNVSSFSEESKYVRSVTSTIKRNQICFGDQYSKIEKIARQKFTAVIEQIEKSRSWKLTTLVTVMNLSSLSCVASSAAFFAGIVLNAEMVVVAAVIVGIVSAGLAFYLQSKARNYENSIGRRDELTLEAYKAMQSGNEDKAIRKILEGAYFEIPSNSKTYNKLQNKKLLKEEINLVKTAADRNLQNAVFYMYLLGSDAWRKKVFVNQSKLLSSGVARENVSMAHLLKDLQDREWSQDAQQSLRSNSSPLATRIGDVQEKREDPRQAFEFYMALTTIDTKKMEVYVRGGFPLNKYLSSHFNDQVSKEFAVLKGSNFISPEAMPLEILIEAIKVRVEHNRVTSEDGVKDLLNALKLFVPDTYIEKTETYQFTHILECLNTKMNVGISRSYCEELYKFLFNAKKTEVEVEGNVA